MERVRPLLIPMRGRMVHELSGQTALPPVRPARARSHLVGRPAPYLNRVLIEEAARHAGVSVRFNQLCLGADVGRDRLRFRDETSAALHESTLTPTIATDGAAPRAREPCRRRLVSVHESGSPRLQGAERAAHSRPAGFEPMRCTSGRAAASC